MSSARTILALIAGLLAVLARAEVTLRFAVWDGDEGLRVVRAAIAEFEKAHPGIRVKLENVPYGAYAQKLLAQYAANAAPDVAMMEPPVFQRFARRGALMPLDPFIEQTPGFDLAAYYQPIVDAHRYQGQLYVLPRDIAPIGLVYYNRRLFREAGLPDPDGSWTWDFEPRPELRDKCFTWVMERLTKRDAQGRTVQWGFVPGWPGAFAETLVYSQGGRFADDPERPTKLLYTDPRVVRTYEFLADLSLRKKWVPSTNDINSILQTSSGQLFVSQKVAMFQSGIWDVPGFRKSIVPGTASDFDWDVTLAPGYTDPATGETVRAAPTGGSGYAVVTGTRHPDEAWKLTQFMAGPVAMRLMAEAGLAQPAIRDLARQAPWSPDPERPDPNRRPANRAVTDEAVAHVVFKPTSDVWGEVSGLVDAKIELILVGTLTAEEGLRQGQALGQKRLDQLRAESDRPLFDWRLGAGAAMVIVGLILFWVYGPERGVAYTLKDRIENRRAYLFILPWVVGMVVFTLGPMVLSILMSAADWDLITPARARGFDNFREAFTQDPRFWVALRVTTVYTVFAVPIGLAVALGMALLLNTKVRGVAVYRTLFYLPALASLVATVLIFRRIFQPDGGLLNTVIYGPDGQGNFLGIGSFLATVTGSSQPANWLGDERLALPSLIIMSVWAAGGSMVILLAGLQAVPQHYYEAARLDGAGPLAQFRNVTFPLLTPALFFTLITGVIGAFQTFTQAFVMTNGGPNDATRFYILHLYDQAFGALRMGYASALAWVLFVIVLAFTWAQFRLNKYVYYEGGAR